MKEVKFKFTNRLQPYLDQSVDPTGIWHERCSMRYSKRVSHLPVFSALSERFILPPSESFEWKRPKRGNCALPQFIARRKAQARANILIKLGENPKMKSEADGVPDSLNITVLVVDDDPLTSGMLAQFLNEMGCLVDTARDGKEAVQKISRQKFDLVLLDLVMPTMSGQETFEIIRGFNEHLPVIIMTANGSNENAIEFLKRGAVDYLPKPIHFEEFRFRVNRALEEKRLREQAVTDVKTRLFNHAYFRKRLEEELGRAKRYGHDLSLLMLDLDNFKDFNDSHGHLAGDGVLIYIGAILKETTRDCDIPCRFGGEEFTIILPVTDSEGAVRVAERVRESIEKAPFNREFPGSVTTSIGVSSYNPEKIFESKFSVNSLIELADQALYLAKKTGKNSVCALQPSSVRVEHS